MFNALNNGRQVSLFPALVIILIILFWILKIWLLCVEFPQNIMPYDIIEWTQALYIANKLSRDKTEARILIA
jgi:hypothetical protein